MLSSMHTIYLVCLKHKANFNPIDIKSKKHLSLSISVSADTVAYKKNINFKDIFSIVSATKFFIEKWKNKEYYIDIVL